MLVLPSCLLSSDSVIPRHRNSALTVGNTYRQSTSPVHSYRPRVFSGVCAEKIAERQSMLVMMRLTGLLQRYHAFSAIRCYDSRLEFSINC